MKKSVIITVSCAAVAILLSTFSIYAFMTDEQPLFSEEAKKLDIPDMSYAPPEQEEPPIQSQPPVESAPKPWAIVKVASELPLLTPEPTKTVVLPHKTVTAAYVTEVSSGFTNTPPRYAYQTDNGDVLEFDAIGGELVYYEAFENARIYEEERNQKPISMAEAQKIAEVFILEHMDLSRYRPTHQSTLINESFSFQYIRYIDDMPTQDILVVILYPSGRLKSYRANPHLFDCVQIGDVDREAIFKRFEDQLRAEGKGLDYTLYNEIITLNDKGEPCVLYEYYYDHDSGEHSGIYSMEIPLIEK